MPANLRAVPLPAAVFLAALFFGVAPALSAAGREVAVTFDDLPGPPGALLSNDVAGLRENTRRLLATLSAHHVPVVGFVNEGKLFREDEGPAEVRQVLLLHANALNADLFGRLAEMMKARGYRFVTLDRALADEAYRRADDYVGAWGISWLHHWELTAGKPRSPSPDPPDWVTKAYEAASHR